MTFRRGSQIKRDTNFFYKSNAPKHLKRFLAANRNSFHGTFSRSEYIATLPACMHPHLCCGPGHTQVAGSRKNLRERIVSSTCYKTNPRVAYFHLGIRPIKTAGTTPLLDLFFIQRNSSPHTKTHQGCSRIGRDASTSLFPPLILLTRLIPIYIAPELISQ